MKFFKVLSLAILAGVAAVGAAAADESYDMFQLAFCENVPTNTATVTTYGVKVGAPISMGAPVFGVEAAVFYAGSDEVTGFQGSLIAAHAKKITGLQLAIVSLAETCDGLQIGIYNHAAGNSFQLGILNHIEGAAVPFLPVVNFRF